MKLTTQIFKSASWRSPKGLFLSGTYLLGYFCSSVFAFLTYHILLGCLVNVLFMQSI